MPGPSVRNQWSRSFGSSENLIAWGQTEFQVNLKLGLYPTGSRSFHGYTFYKDNYGKISIIVRMLSQGRLARS